MDVREKLVELLNEVQETGVNEIPAGFGYTSEYVSNKTVASHLIANGVVDALERKADYLKNIDYLTKINLWLMQRYREDLFGEFGIDANDILAATRMFNSIYEEQCKKMPLPWYQYGFGKKEK